MSEERQGPFVTPTPGDLTVETPCGRLNVRGQSIPTFGWQGSLRDGTTMNKDLGVGPGRPPRKTDIP